MASSDQFVRLEFKPEKGLHINYSSGTLRITIVGDGEPYNEIIGRFRNELEYYIEEKHREIKRITVDTHSLTNEEVEASIMRDTNYMLIDALDQRRLTNLESINVLPSDEYTKEHKREYDRMVMEFRRSLHHDVSRSEVMKAMHLHKYLKDTIAKGGRIIIEHGDRDDDEDDY